MLSGGLRPISFVLPLGLALGVCGLVAVAGCDSSSAVGGPESASPAVAEVREAVKVAEGTRRAKGAEGAYAALPVDRVAPADSEPTPCRAAGAPVVEPYRWYPALDLARVPFHVADGAWGARRPIAAPEPPRIRRRVEVSSAAALEREAMVPGSQITLVANLDRAVTLLGDVTDLDLIVPPGVSMKNLYVGRASPPSRSRRVRIRGTTPGQHSGGRLGTVTFFSDFSDGIIDGVDLNGDDGDRNALAWYLATDPGERFAIVNVRAHAPASIALHAEVVDLVIAGNNLFSGARSREANGFPEGWGLRGGRRLVVFDNRIEGTRYHRVRVHPGAEDDEYAWIADNVLVDPYEARIVWAAKLPGSTTAWDGFWAVCNDVYAHSNTSTGCISASFEAPDAAFARLTHNRFFGTITKSDQAARARGDQDYLTGNRFEPWRAPAAWKSPGDPRDIPLPAPGTPVPQDPACPGPA